MSKIAATLMTILALGLSGCTPYCGRHFHIQFTNKDGLKIIEMGKIRGEGILQYKKIPLKYELRREAYTLDLEAVSIFPAMAISGRSGSESLSISTVPISGGYLDECHSQWGSMRGKPYETVYMWMDNPACSGSEKIEIVISSTDGTEIGREVLPFFLMEDGVYCVPDGF